MIEKLKNIIKNKYFKIVTFTFFWLFILSELFALFIDFYNFRQLEKVKVVLKDIKREDKEFYNLKELNDIYNINIKPIKNCYDITKFDNIKKPKYMFWFKLESYIYRNIYWEKYYAYPKYSYDTSRMCTSWVWCYDASMEYFIKTISNSCEN